MKRAGARRLAAGGALAALLLATCGCAVYRTAAAPVKLTAKTVVVASDTAGAVVGGGGKLVSSGARLVGTAGSAGIDAAARLARADMVTFVNAADGRVTRVPWREGLALSGAASAGRVELAGQGLELIRDGRVIVAARQAVDVLVAAGDVVRLLR